MEKSATQGRKINWGFLLYSSACVDSITRLEKDKLYDWLDLHLTTTIPILNKIYCLTQK